MEASVRRSEQGRNSGGAQRQSALAPLSCASSDCIALLLRLSFERREIAEMPVLSASALSTNGSPNWYGKNNTQPSP